jgi:MFS family permease
MVSGSRKAAAVRDYARVLRVRDYRLLWSGSVASLFGDGMTWVALAWMALKMGGPGVLGAISVCYTMPVIVGGALIGPLLDRMSRRVLLVTDSLFRAAVVGAVPILSAFGDLRLWQLFVVATVYGLFKIVPMGVAPAVMPDIVPKDLMQPAVALETLSFGAAGLAGPALGGLLIAARGAPSVLAVDAVSYLVLVLCVLAMRDRLPRPESAGAMGLRQSFGWGPVFSLLKRDGVLITITVSFALFNCAIGMQQVATPWIVAERLRAGSATLGLFLGVANGAGLAGALIAGALKPSDRQMGRIGLLQILAGAGFLLLLVPSAPVILTGLVLVEVFSTPMTVSAQVIRLARIPAEVRGRMMTFLRTMMNTIAPAGAGIAGPLLIASLFAPLVVLMTLIAVLPGLLIAVRYRATSFGDELGLAQRPAPAQETAST